MIVYVEYVLFDNFVIDCLLLKTSLDLFGIAVKKPRLMFCGVLGGLFALFFPTFDYYSLLSFFIKVLFGGFLVFLSAKHSSFSSYLKATALFFLFTFATGGAVTGLYGLLSVTYPAELPVALAFIPAYFFIKVSVIAIKRAVRKKSDEKLRYKVELICGEKRVITEGFMDTGNGLRSEGRPVIVLDKSVFKKLFTVDLGAFAVKKVAVTTVFGESESLAFTVQRVKIYFADEPNIYTNVSAIVSKTPLFYGAILHPDLKERKDA